VLPPPARRLVARFRQLDPVLVDRLAALALLIAVELQIWLGGDPRGQAAEAVGGAIVCAAVAIRRRWPLGALVVGVGASVGADALSGPASVSVLATLPAAILGFYGAGAFLPARRSQVALASGVGLLAVDVVITTRSSADLFFDAVIIGLAPWAAGRMSRGRAELARAHRERAERLDSERELRARTAAYGERARIARELHDVIAHSVSVMVIQAGGARVVMASDPARAQDSLRLVERAGRDALAEMRRLLGLLDGETDPRALAPQPRLADLEALVVRTRAAGLATDLQIEGQAPDVSPAFDLCAYRIVQEALTNAIKHAGPARVRVHLRWAREMLELEISDDGYGPTASDPAIGGHGIAGMRERAGLHGGDIRAGAGANGGFAVIARLPLAPERVR
jgi:signal transduction histidine kinase